MQITRKGSELFYTLGKNAPAEVGAGVGWVGYQSSVSLAEFAVKLL